MCCIQNYNLKNQKMLHIIPDAILHHIACFMDSMRQLNSLCLTSKSFHIPNYVWLTVAKRVTGYNSTPFDENSSDFRYRLRLLVCPWMSLHQRFVDVPYVSLEWRPIVCLDLNGDELVVHAALYGLAGFDSVMYTCSARDCRGWKASVARWPSRSVAFRRGSVRFISKKVHNSATALIDFPEGRIFFISGLRVLQCLDLGIFRFSDEVDIASAPCEMWILSVQKVLYFGPREDQRTVEEYRGMCPLCSHISSGASVCPLCRRPVTGSYDLDEVVRVLRI